MHDDYTIGDALLRLAEKAAVKKMNDEFARHLMPYQVGVAVKGGLNMWATVVECLLQRDVGNVAVAIDLGAIAGSSFGPVERRVAGGRLDTCSVAGFTRAMSAERRHCGVTASRVTTDTFTPQS